MKIKNLMKQAQQMQMQMQETQDRIAQTMHDGSSGGGMVTVKVTGKGELKSVKLDPKIVDPSDIEMLEDLIVAAVNDGTNKANEYSQNEMAKITAGLSLPGGMDFPF